MLQLVDWLTTNMSNKEHPVSTVSHATDKHTWIPDVIGHTINLHQQKPPT